MQNTKRWMIVVIMILAVLPLAACGGSEETVKEAPARVEEISGSGFNRVVLTEKAAERLGIQTAPVKEGEASDTQTVKGEVTDPSEGIVRVSFKKGTVAKMDMTQSAHVLLEDNGDEDEEEGWLADLFEPEDADDDGDDDEESLFFTLASAQNGLTVGQPVFVKLATAGGAAQGMVIPYAAVIYGLNGETWAYTNPEPLTFVRHLITVDHIDGGLAYLSDGPPLGSDVVTVGVAELYGADTGVGK